MLRLESVFEVSMSYGYGGTLYIIYDLHVVTPVLVSKFYRFHLLEQNNKSRLRFQGILLPYLSL